MKLNMDLYGPRTPRLVGDAEGERAAQPTPAVSPSPITSKRRRRIATASNWWFQQMREEGAAPERSEISSLP
jgi:hypothetical protein